MMVGNQPAAQKVNVDSLIETCEKPAVKYAIEKPILLHFFNFSTIISPGL